MAKFNNFGGGGFGGGNMQMLMKQAQKMQEDMKNAQEEIDETEIEGSAGGLVSVVINGNKKPLSVKISPEAMDDSEMLEDLLLVALNDASDKADKLKEQKMGRFGGGLF